MLIISKTDFITLKLKTAILEIAKNESDLLQKSGKNFWKLKLIINDFWWPETFDNHSVTTKKLTKKLILHYPCVIGGGSGAVDVWFDKGKNGYIAPLKFASRELY